ncbi:MAG: sulfatase [bacterium]|nr:sulfatase [bacterium]
MSSKLNIIFITFDSGRADHMGFLGYRKGITPFLDSLAKKGVYFKRAFATGPGSSVSSAGYLASTYPLDHGGYAYIDKPRVLLSEAMHDNGYETVAVHSSPYHTKYFGYERGWDRFHYATYFRSRPKNSAKPQSGTEETISPGLRKSTLKSKILRKSFSIREWLKTYAPPLAPIFKALEKIVFLFRKILKDMLDFRPGFYTADELNEEVKYVLPSKPDQPLFLWAYYMDPHVPYALFGRKKGSFWLKFKYHLSDICLFLFGEGPMFLNQFFIPLYKHLYDQSVAHVDENIKKLFEHLGSLGIDEKNSIFIIHSDHGEAFYEHGTFGHTQILFNVNIQVPLIFYGVGIIPAAIERPVSLIDLPTTVLDLAGIPHPSSYKGKNLFSGEAREVVAQASECDGDLSNASFTGITIIWEGYKLIHWKDKRYLFTLDDVEEKNDLYDTKKDIVKDLESRLVRYPSSI